MAGEFFDGRKPAAFLKHGLLSRYLRIFVQKVGSTSTGNKVAFVDGYAGPGRYDDESPGSPALAAEVAQIVDDSDDHIIGHLVEEDPDHYEELKALIAKERPKWTVYKGRVEQHLDTILAAIPGMPLFAFLDPFGLGIPFETLSNRILARSSAAKVGHRPRAATEVLLNFSLAGLRRNAGHLESPSTNPTYLKARETILGNLDANMNGPWWRHTWTTELSGDREIAILDRYVDEITALPGKWHVTVIPVANRWKGPPVYFLLHLTQHPDGVWLFLEALSNATEKYRAFCHESAGQLDLDNDTPEVWVGQIEDNLRRLMDQHGEFEIGDHVTDVYGNTLGYARERHVRQAIKNLNKRKYTASTGKGDVASHRMIPSTPDDEQQSMF